MRKQNKPAEENLVVIHTSQKKSSPENKISTNNSIQEVNRLIAEHGDKVKQVHLHGKIGDLEHLDKDFRGIIKIFAKSKKEVITHSQLLAGRRCYLCPEFPLKKSVDITFITSMGIAVDLLYRVDQMKKDVVLEILNHYLHHSPLETPVEPFHFILMSKLKATKVNLWNLHLLFPDQVKEYYKSIPKEQPGCLSCLHFHFCFSWGKYEKDTCELWQAILDCLQQNAAAIKSSFRRLCRGQAPRRGVI